MDKACERNEDEFNCGGVCECVAVASGRDREREDAAERRESHLGPIRREQRREKGRSPLRRPAARVLQVNDTLPSDLFRPFDGRF